MTDFSNEPVEKIAKPKGPPEMEKPGKDKGQKGKPAPARLMPRKAVNGKGEAPQPPPPDTPTAKGQPDNKKAAKPAPKPGGKKAPAPAPKPGDSKTSQADQRGAQFQETVPNKPSRPEDNFILLVDPDKEDDVDPRELARNEANAIKNQAEEALKAARKEGEKIREQAYEEGYAQGMSEGEAASRAKVEAVCDNLTRALAGLGEARDKVLAVMEREMLSLVLGVVDRILMGAEAVAPQVVARVVREAIRRLGDAERVTVRLNPADLAEMEKAQPSLAQQVAGLHLEADPQLQPGDVVAQSPVAQVDATMETRRQRVFDLLEDAFRRGEPLDLEAVATQPWPGKEQEVTAPSPSGTEPQADPQAGEDLESW